MKAGQVLKLITAVFLIWNTLMYLAIAMITWQYNPADWEQAHRFAFVMVGIYIGLALSLVVMLGVASFPRREKEEEHQITFRKTVRLRAKEDVVKNQMLALDEEDAGRVIPYNYSMPEGSLYGIALHDAKADDMVMVSARYR